MNVSSNQFGLIVAYLLPGFIGLAGIAPLVPAVANWLQPANQAQASFGAPIYALLAATTVGMIANCMRWLVIDHILRWLGVIPPVWDDSRLDKRLVAFNYLVENHYRYYQFVANSLVVVVGAYWVNRWMGTSPLLGFGTDLGFLILGVTLFAASRDALLKYYARTGRLLGHAAEKGNKGSIMHNGNHHQQEGGRSVKPRPQTTGATKPDVSPKPQQEKNKTTASAK